MNIYTFILQNDENNYDLEVQKLENHQTLFINLTSF